MEAYTKFMGKTVEDAVQEACIELGTTSDNLDYRVIVHETKGFLGFGAKQAVIEARKKVTDDDLFDEIMREEQKDKKSADRDRRGKGKNKKPASYEKKNVDAEEVKEEVQKEEPAAAEPAEKEEKVKEEPAEKKKDKKPQKSEKKAASQKKEVREKETAPEENKEEPVEKEEKKPREMRVPADPAVVKSRAEEFLSKTFEAMDLDVTIETSYEEDTLYVDLSGDDMGILIGKRGQTLDSLQYLTSLVVNKGKAAYVRVKLDTENYRERRKATLENLARNIAFKVKKTRRSIYLEPMNPYERRIIHSALQNDPYVTTHSEGEEPLRKVVVTLKKKEYNASFEEDDE